MRLFVSQQEMIGTESYSIPRSCLKDLVRHSPQNSYRYTSDAFSLPVVKRTVTANCIHVLLNVFFKSKDTS